MQITNLSNLDEKKIGKCGELLVQYKLLLNGIESLHFPDGQSNCLIAYTKSSKKPITILVRTIVKAKPGGERQKLALEWIIQKGTKVDVVALVDLSRNKVWLFTIDEISVKAQKNSNGNYNLYMYVDPSALHKKETNDVMEYEFKKYQIENKVGIIF